MIEKYVVLEAFEVEDEADILPELHVTDESDDEEFDQELFIWISFIRFFLPDRFEFIYQ